VEDRPPTGVGERHPVELQGEGLLGQGGSVGTRIGHVRRRVQDPDDATPARKGVLCVGEHLRAHLDRAHEEGDEEGKRQHGAGGDVTVDAEQHPDDDHPCVGETR
jgi:hypothetical protein